MASHDALFDFASANLDRQDEKAIALFNFCKYVCLKTQWAPQITHQNQAIILRQLCYAKMRFAVLIPGAKVKQ